MFVIQQPCYALYHSEMFLHTKSQKQLPNCSLVMIFKPKPQLSIHIHTGGNRIEFYRTQDMVLRYRVVWPASTMSACGNVHV